MDSGDVSLSIRRARRSNAKSLNLSRRGLQAWPEDVFALRQLESLDMSGNELVEVDGRIAQLELLEELDLSNNKLQSFSEQLVANMASLRSLVLDGNPVASQMPPTTVRQLARPGRTPGQTPAQVIYGLLASQAPAFTPKPPPVPDVGGSQVEEIGADDGFGPAPPPPPPVDLDSALAGGSAPWRKEQKALIDEVERLQAQVTDLEGQLAASKSGAGGAGSSSAPSWLQDNKRAMASTLPSRRSGFAEDDEVADLKNQLREEQRKSKRLEQQNQRMTDRVSEMQMGAGKAGSLPHFEMTEVELGEIINQGGFSVVHKGTWHGTKVGVKKLFDPNISAELLAEFDNEVQKLEQIRHPHILQVLGLHRKPPALCLIMELVEGGSLYQLLHSPHQFSAAPTSAPLLSGGLQVNQCLEILDASAGALAFLHARGIAHRDVKSHNILLSPHLEVKLCDFGLARMRSELMTGSMQFAGTPHYMAPEIFRNQKYTESVDVFAFGTVIWEAMAVDIPFANLDAADIRDRVIVGRMLEIPTLTPPAMTNLIQACWTLEYKDRPQMSEVLAYLRENKDGGGASRARRPRTAMPSTGTREPLG
mmetsp:Transcript_59185/g.105184  ORF Transcript_59185/g.105184 Transcript_59185/m.105184 type:complete len:592 (+) Transcript_59185:47-1822(+)